jgi:hypothetical protein
LRNGESAVLSILIQTPETAQLGTISASIVIASREVSRSIPISLTVSSNILMNLTVIVEDEYTYFASGQPLVDNAEVTLINYQRGIRITERTEAANGTVTFANINEDRYEMIVEAPNHRTLNQIIITSEDTPVITVFIERQAVTYTWSVTPVTFEDTYILTVEADFETHVPIPVVTVTPTEFDLEELELGFIDSIQMNITNHGLIRANDVNLQLPESHPFLEFTLNTGDLGDLEPLSSITATVQVSRRSGIQKRAAASAVVWTVYIIKIAYSYICGDLQLRSIPVSLKKRTIVPIATAPPFQCINCGGGGPSGDGGGGGPVFSFNGYSARTPAFCNKCLQSILGCVPDPKFPLAGCIPMIAAGQGISNVWDAIGWMGCTVGFEWLAKGTRGRRIAKGIELFGCFRGIYTDCLSSDSGSASRRRRSLLSSVNEVVESMYPIHQSIALGVEVLGDEAWLSVGDNTWLTQVLRPVLDDTTEGGVLISTTELSAILAAPPPNGATVEMVTRMVERLNNTLNGWNNGQLEPDNTTNIASFTAIHDLSSDIHAYNERAVGKGFSSYLDAYNFARNEINQVERWEDEAGVCAVVRIRIEQELAVTREAFLAKLEIENQEETPLQRMELEIVIIDSSNGELATHLFSIGNETLSGSLRGALSMWMLPSGGSGAAEWLIIPYSEAAPEADHAYDVGGVLRYILDDENVTIPLLPTVITVRPDPSLSVHYFWEKNVIGNDPFTEEIEPSVPFTLGVAVKNAGYGTANQLQIASGQPEIVENRKGLLVNFMIIGTLIGNGSVSSSLTVMLGDLTPNTTVVARWFIISSLQGQFRNYSATFENINPLGDPKLSILDELEIHELIRNVKIYGNEEDDGVLDFLVNDRNDYMEYPDGLYSSKSLQMYNVSVGDIVSVRSTDDVVIHTLEVRASSNETGWIYYRYEDTQNLLRSTALTVNGTKLEANETTPIPPENSWITRDTNPSRNTETLYLHILDYVSTIDEVTFTMTLCTSNCPSVEKPFIPPTSDTVPTTPPPVHTSAQSDITTLSGEFETTTGKAVSPALSALGAVIAPLLAIINFLS